MTRGPLAVIVVALGLATLAPTATAGVEDCPEYTYLYVNGTCIVTCHIYVAGVVGTCIWGNMACIDEPFMSLFLATTDLVQEFYPSFEQDGCEDADELCPDRDPESTGTYVPVCELILVG